MSSDSTFSLESIEQFARLGDVTITLEAELDHTTTSFLDVGRWVPGTLLRLPSSAGETISIHAGRVRLGAGEVLVVDGVLTLRVSDLVSMPDMPDLDGASEA
jgi:flagellar motor switch/type III secretory pathway protein FliN